MNVEFLEALEEMAKEEGIEREELYAIVAQGLEAAYRTEHGEVGEIEVKIDRNTGDIKLLAGGEEVGIDISDFGRIATRRAEETIRQEIIQRRREIIYERYSAKVGEMISGAVHRFAGGDVWLNLGKAEALLAEEERIPGERYRPGEQLRAYLFRVERTQGDPRILVSRAHPKFVELLLELEVPEIEQGLVKIEAVAREPGI
ncbi:MAG: NusA N-terminal domain-containing protein, partial [Candidatus Bipolaricaulia bacterium]